MEFTVATADAFVAVTVSWVICGEDDAPFEAFGVEGVGAPVIDEGRVANLSG